MPLSIAGRKEETTENRSTENSSTELQPLQHKLAAILYADVEGYSRLTGADEGGTHRTLSAYLDLFAETIRTHRGEVKHYAGDAVLAVFMNGTRRDLCRSYRRESCPTISVVEKN